MEALQCHGIASSSDLRAQTYTAFRRKILVCKTKLIKTFEILPNNTKSIISSTEYFSIMDDY